MLYTKYLKMHLRSSMQYRFNTTFISITQVLVSVGEVLSVWMLFGTFTSIGGYGFYECLLLMGITFAVFSLSECFACGYDEFSDLIRSGDFDRILIRPVNINYQILASKFDLVKLPRVALGLTISIIALVNLNIEWDVLKVLVFISTIISGTMIVVGIFIISAGISIYTIEQLEFVNILTHGSKEIAYYPINIYAKWLTRIFTFVIPVACFNYLPLSFLLGIGNIPMWLCGLAPVFGMLFIIPCLLFFNFSLKKYKSSGS